MKIAKAASAAAVGVALLEVIDPATMEWLWNWSLRLPRPVETDIAKRVIGHFGSLNGYQIQALGWSALAYAAISTMEGIGLWLGHRWGQWLSALITGCFIPVELIEWIRQASLIRTAVLAINIAVLIYLILRIGIDRRRKNLRPLST